MKHSVLIGIGGCGTKCVEAAVHLASSQFNNHTIYPVIIDQDKTNGNIERLKNVINSYIKLHEAAKGVPRNWPFGNTIIKYDELLPIAPVDENLNFASAIGEPSMSEEEKAIVQALYTPNQMQDYILNQGFKKRAHMGSLLFEDFVENEKTKDFNEIGLNYLCNQIKSQPNLEITIFASLFGGTGISGFYNVGKYLKEKLPSADLRVVLLTPYFILKSNDTENEDASLVKSNSDMIATRIALEIYGPEIEKVFHKIFIIGSDLNHLGDETPSDKFTPYGKEQINKSHLFELIAASTIFADLNESGVLEFNLSTIKNNLPIQVGNSDISLEKFFSSINIDYSNIKKLLNFAHLLTIIDKEKLFNNESWRDRQPWINSSDQDTLLGWGLRYYQWFEEMKNWKLFSLDFEPMVKNIKPFKFNSLLTIYLYKNKNDLGSLLKTIELLKL